MRDNFFYMQLGFEHGYAGNEQSYPDNKAYAMGYVEGVSFRLHVTQMTPSLELHENGSMTVEFRYVMRDLAKNFARLD